MTNFEKWKQNLKPEDLIIRDEYEKEHTEAV